MAISDNSTGAAKTPSIQDAGRAAAQHVEKTYQDNGAVAAENALRSDFLTSAQHPAKDAANMTEIGYEVSQLQVDGQFHHDGTLLACAIDWGLEHIGSLGATDEPTLAKEASGDLTGSDTAAADVTASPDARYSQLMASTLDSHYQELAGIAHKELDPMASKKLTLSDLELDQSVQESIRTYHPAPPPKPGLGERLLEMLGLA